MRTEPNIIVDGEPFLVITDAWDYPTAKAKLHFITKDWSEAAQLRKPNGQFDGTTGSGGGGKSGGGADVSDKELRTMSEDAQSSLDEVQLNTIGGYADSATAFETNSYLRTGDIGQVHPKLADRRKQNLDQRVERMDSVMKPVGKEVAVYRVIHTDGVKLEVGDTFIDKGFLSTSVDPDIIGGFAGRDTALKLTVGADIKGFPMNGLSNRDFEKEMVLERGLKIRITGSGMEKIGSVDVPFLHGVVERE